MTCLHCSAPTSNGLALCERCRVAASVYLEFFPVYFRNLARWRPGRAGTRPVPASREPQGLAAQATDPVMRALDEAGADLTGWARALRDDRGVEIPEADDEAAMMAAVCRMLNAHLSSIATLEWAGEFVRLIGDHEGKLRRLTERVAPGWYAGACRHCETPTHVIPGLTWVTCDGCGATTYARDHLDVILAEARGWVARPKPMAEAIVALVDTEVSVPRLHDRIRKWESMGWLEGVRKLDADGDPVGPKRYRFGEVLDMVLGSPTAETHGRAMPA